MASNQPRHFASPLNLCLTPCGAKVQQLAADIAGGRAKALCDSCQARIRAITWRRL